MIHHGKPILASKSFVKCGESPDCVLFATQCSLSGQIRPHRRGASSESPCFEPEQIASAFRTSLFILLSRPSGLA